jgi:endoglucanase
MLKKFKKLLSLVLIAGLLTASACKPSDEATEPTEPTAPTSASEPTEGNPTEAEGSSVEVQLMAREGNMWSDFFRSDVIEITGDGTYSGTLSITGGWFDAFPMLIISAVGTTVEDGILSNAVKAPSKFLNATVTIDFVKVDGTELTLTNHEDVLLVPDDGPLEGYANVQLWNAWWEPNQRIVPQGIAGIVPDRSDLVLGFNSPVSRIEIQFTVSNVGASAPVNPVTATPATTREPALTQPPVSVNVTGDFNTSLTSTQLVREIGVGWNLGNTLDAYNSGNPSEQFHWVDYDVMSSVETAWIGWEAVTTPQIIRMVKDAGFNAVRIPVTWYKMAGGDPDYTIREDWMNHVQNVVNMAVAEDLYVIINTHHDEYIMRFDNPDEGERAVTALWRQIANRFKDYNEKLIFEGLNEPRHRTNSWNTQGQWDWNGNSDRYATLNRWNQAFVNAVRATGGNNQYRHLMLATYAAQGTHAPLNGFVMPVDPVSGNGKDKFILSIHIYSPHGWAHNGHGSYSGDGAVRGDLERVANRASELGVPVILGEFGTLARNNHDQRVQHAYDYVRIATEMRNRSPNPVVMACVWWDDSGSFRLIHRTMGIDDKANEIVTALMNARKGLPLG